MKTIDITIGHNCVTLQPVPRAELAAFIKHMQEIQAIWIEERFSTADAILRDDCWGHMEAIAAMLPTHDAPAVRGFPLGKLANDYAQLEQLFFGDASEAYDANYLDESAALQGFNLPLFKGCALLDLHRFEPKKKLIAAYSLYQEKSQKAQSKPKTSRSKAAATKTQTRSRTLSKASERKTA